MGRKVDVALSTAKGVRKLVDNEIVHFNFPLPTSSYKSQWIVRISTKRSGEAVQFLLVCRECLSSENLSKNSDSSPTDSQKLDPVQVNFYFLKIMDNVFCSVAKSWNRYTKFEDQRIGR